MAPDTHTTFAARIIGNALFMLHIFHSHLSLYPIPICFFRTHHRADLTRNPHNRDAKRRRAAEKPMCREKKKDPHSYHAEEEKNAVNCGTIAISQPLLASWMTGDAAAAAEASSKVTSKSTGLHDGLVQ